MKQYVQVDIFKNLIDNHNHYAQLDELVHSLEQETISLEEVQDCLTEISNEHTFGMEGIINSYLVQIAKRAIELDDLPLLTLLTNLGVLSETSEE